MNYPVNDIRNNLINFDFKRLFIEDLGWSNFNNSDLKLAVNGENYNLKSIAEMEGMPVFLLEDQTKTAIESKKIRQKIERKLSGFYREHIIIYCDYSKTIQIWQWVKRQKSEPLSIREYTLYKGQTGEALIQKLRSIFFGYADFEDINISDVTNRASQAFDLEKVTKKFFEQFNKERKKFGKLIEGLPNEELKEWYVSVLLNRLMFTYFIQKKGFLNNDVNYLRNNLNKIQELYPTRDRYFTEFLCLLFFKGFALIQEKRSSHTNKLLGTIPYLNGGLFIRHQIEKQYPDIIIKDEAFENILDFFDKYNWHLDDRPDKKDNEINPDVLGYIFEKYINQKQMGAYYTKEDITNYITKNSIIPYMFLELIRKTNKFHEILSFLNDMLAKDPDRYIYPSVRKGNNFDFSSVESINSYVSDGVGLHTETYSEMLTRVKNYNLIVEKLKSQGIKNIEDIVTLNLDVRQIMQDFIEECEDSELVYSLFNLVKDIKILDPTCGSGAFLFEALNILEPIYYSLINRLQDFRLDSKFKFQEQLEQLTKNINQHVNQDYFVMKTIMVNNLYGVDIMEEATEICKLRLFLKLISQINNIEEIEPLPDIDFNIRAGNTLIGIEKTERAYEVVESTLDFDGFINTLNVKMNLIKNLFEKYRNEQINSTHTYYHNIKEELNIELASLKRELNRYLKNVHNEHADYIEWVEKNLPFHWFIDFYSIMENGGFDVIIGNPPYVEYSKVKKQYELYDYETIRTGNLYAYVLERCNSLLSRDGLMGMIIPHSAFCTDRMAPLMKLYSENKFLWISTYSIRPSKLFVGVDQRLAIMIYKPDSKENKVFTTKYHHWMENYRQYLFENLIYMEHTDEVKYYNSIPKLSSSVEGKIWNKIIRKRALVNDLGTRSDEIKIYYHNGPRYWIRAMDFVPYFWNEKDGVKMSSHVKPLHVKTIEDGAVVSAMINSSLFFWWFILLSNCRDLSAREINNFPLGLSQMPRQVKSKLVELNSALMLDYQAKAQRKHAKYSTGKVEYDEFYPRLSKGIIDMIDDVLGSYFELNTVELQYIKNFEIKVRLGADEEE
ncbi:Eco57I restriction-modification methylase domain-containing protein [Lysinibacillus capsici]|uniref:Eco57I restriction-modification methylase domain-containing protein n=1 Tax=Lysinibacillus capsici TaxID=2115968 RepID=UPI00325FB056